MDMYLKDVILALSWGVHLDEASVYSIGVSKYFSPGARFISYRTQHFFVAAI